MDSLIISQGSMLASGATNPAIPGTPGGSKGGGGTRSTGVGKVTSMLVTAAGHPSAVHTSSAVTTAIRKGESALVEANSPSKYSGPKVAPMGEGNGPSTFLSKVLGGHLPMSWLTAGPKGR